MPAVFVSHGAPPLADDPTWPQELATWSAQLPNPASILMISAHWEEQPPTLSATQRELPLVYDFWGFPARYYSVTYPAPTAPGLATQVERLLTGWSTVRRDETRGLDHGAYVPLVEMYPHADVPVLQLSLPTLNPLALFELGQRLAPLREEGVLVVGSGFTTHNLAWFDPRQPADAPPPTASAQFDAWAESALTHADIDAILNTPTVAPAAAQAHPRTEHWAPLYVALGAAVGPTGNGVAARSMVDGFWYGLSKRSWQLEAC